MGTIYALIPKWLLAILVVMLLAGSIYLGIKMEYYKIDNDKLTNDNKILTDNSIVLKDSIAICQKGLKAEVDNVKTQQKITKETQDTQDKINNTCVKEGSGEKTNITDAIILSNQLSDRFNSMWNSGKDNKG